MGYYTIPDFNGHAEGSRLVFETAGEVAWLEPYGKDAIRFRSSRSLRIDQTLNWTLLPPSDCDGTIEITQKMGILSNGNIKATITGDGTVTYYKTKDNTILLEEYWIDGRVHTAPLRRAREYAVKAGDSFKISVYFKPDDEEHFYGMGEDANNCFDLKGTTTDLFQKNGKCTIPYVYSTKGYGFLWNNPSIGRAEFVRNQTLWYAECAKQIDYIIISGDSVSDINTKFTAITGRAPKFPQWAAGFWQCKLRYETQEQLLAVAREYHRRNLPLSVIVIDYFHWTQQGEWKFDPSRWPDPKGMVEELRSMGIRLMVSIWPTVDPRSENYSLMEQHNYVLHNERGVDVVFMFFGPQNCVDFTNPDAQEFVWSRIEKNYYDNGIKMFWLDEAEPEMRPYGYDNVRMYLGNGEEVSNLYCVGYAKAIYDGMKKNGETEICNLIRCAWFGSQRYGVVLWSGDISSTFESFRKQIKIGLNVSLCGIPWWTTDIGGFVNGNPEDPEFRELLVRWFQFGAFCPVFRLHGFRLPEPVRDITNPDGYCGSGGPNEVWSFGEENYAILTKYMQVRQKLIPYIMMQMDKASKDGTPLLRPLFFDFENDSTTYSVDDEFMFGPDLLIAPITHYRQTEREVYLPGDGIWRDAKTGKTYRGSQGIVVNAPLEDIPVFYRGEIDMQLFPITKSPDNSYCV
jgi:alpha-D-xyloside xylohydrolase